MTRDLTPQAKVFQIGHTAPCTYSLYVVYILYMLCYILYTLCYILYTLSSSDCMCTSLVPPCLSAGILSTVAGLASALCPAAVPWLAQQGGRSPWLGWQSLMWVTLAMATLQLIFTLATLTAGCVHRRALARRRAEARGQVISTGGQQASQHRHHQQRQVHVQHGEGQRQGHGSGLLPCPAPMAPRPYGASGSRCSGGRGSPPGGGLQAAGAGHSTSTGAGSSGSGGKPAQRQTAAAVVICSGGGRSPLGAVGGGRGAAAGYGHSPLSRPLLQVDLS